MKTALVTSIGSVAGDVVIRNLKKAGFRVVGCDIYPKSWNVDAGSVDVFYQAPLASDISAYVRFVREVCQKEEVRYLLPLTDVEVDVWNDRRALLQEIGCTVCISPGEAIDTIRNKKTLADFIGSSGGCVTPIPTVFLRDADLPPWDFPLVLKPYNGRSSQGRVYLYDRKEWDAFTSFADPDRYIVQPFIDGPVIVTELVRQADGRKSIAMSRQELIRTPHGCGTTVRVFSDEALENGSLRLADALGVVGCVNFEYIRDHEGKYHFIECNPRFSAGVEFLCMAGYDYVLNHIRCFSGEEIDDAVEVRPMTIARKYEEYITDTE